MTELSVGTASGAAFTTQPQVTIINNIGKTGIHTSAVITATISTGGTLVGTTTASTLDGVATFSNLGFAGTAGTTYTITYSVGALTIATHAVTAALGAASRLALTRPSVGLATGAAFAIQPQVTIQDAGGNTVTSSAVITATISAGGTLVGTTTATAVNGVATFSNLGSSGVAGATYTITYSSGALTVATQSVSVPVPVPVPVPVGAAARLALTRLSVGSASGAAFAIQPQVTIQDVNGNTVTSSSAVVIATISAGGILVGTNTATAVNGVATFTNLGSAGINGIAYTITYYTISHLPNYLTTVTQVVGASVGAATRLAVSRSSAGTASDAAFTTQPQVVLQDAGGNTVTSSSAVITAAMTTGAGTFVGTATAATSGVATFTDLEITGIIGSRTITYTSGSLTSATETFTLTFGAATKLALTTSAIGGVASAVNFPTQPAVTVQDSANNTVTNYTGNVGVAITANSGTTTCTLGGTPTVAFNGTTGVVTFAGLNAIEAVTTSSCIFTLTFTTSVGSFAVSQTGITTAI